MCVNIFIGLTHKNEIFNTGNGNIRIKKKTLQINMISFQHNRIVLKLNLDDVSENCILTNTIIKDPSERK